MDIKIIATTKQAGGDGGELTYIVPKWFIKKKTLAAKHKRCYYYLVGMGDTHLYVQKTKIKTVFLSSGGWIRTHDLRVMSSNPPLID